MKFLLQAVGLVVVIGLSVFVGTRVPGCPNESVPIGFTGSKQLMDFSNLHSQCSADCDIRIHYRKGSGPCSFVRHEDIYRLHCA
jgi:hypothetical protein